MKKIIEIFWDEEIGKTSVKFNNNLFNLPCQPTCFLDIAQDISGDWLRSEFDKAVGDTETLLARYDDLAKDFNQTDKGGEK